MPSIDREENRAYHRAYSRKRRAKLLAILGDKCTVCESTEDLEFDHVDPSLKSFNISSNLTASNVDILRELSKCQLLCANCHIEKTRRESLAAGFTHGSMYGWQKANCECEECESARLLWYQTRNALRRAIGARGEYQKRSDLEHGSRSKYRAGCRCVECLAANADASRAQYMKKKS